MSGGDSAAAKPPLLVRYVAVGRLSSGADPADNSIVASHCTTDDPADASAYAKWFRALMTTHAVPLRDNADARFHKLMPNADGETDPQHALHMYWLASAQGQSAADQLLVYFAVCAPLFPERTPLNGPSQLLWELRENMTKTFGAGLARASEGGDVQARALPLLEALCFVHGIDKFAHLDDALTRVKEQMHANITHALQNAEQLQAMEERAAELEEFAAQWHIGTQAVARKMCWQKWKTQIILIAIVLILLVVIVTPIVTAAEGPEHPDEGGGGGGGGGGGSGNSVGGTAV